MNELRWILASGGVLLVVGIYLWGRRARPSVAERPPPKLVVPQLDEAVAVRRRTSDPALASGADAPLDSDHLPSISATDSVREPVVGEFIMTGNLPAHSSEVNAERIFAQEAVDQPVVERASIQAAATPAKKSPARRKIIALRLSTGEARVPGAKLKSWLEEAGLRHGKYSIYHRMYDEQTPLFSVASMVEPGTFDPQTMTDQQFPGVTLFMQLPGPIDGMELLSRLLACARDLERKMGGILQDERGLPLTEPRVQRLRDEAADFLHLLGQS